MFCLTFNIDWHLNKTLIDWSENFGEGDIYVILALIEIDILKRESTALEYKMNVERNEKKHR